MYILYRLLLYIHIFSVILLLGPFFVLLPLVKKLKTSNPEVREGYLAPFLIAVQLAKHAGHALIISGILLVTFGSWTFLTPWIIITIVILIGSTSFLSRAFSPTLKKLKDPSQEPPLQFLNRSIWIYIILLMTMLLLMVVKPMFW